MARMTQPLKRLMTIDEMMKRRAKRTSAFEQKQLNRETIKAAIINTIQPFYSGREIIDIDIPALTTELVEIKIYIKE